MHRYKATGAHKFSKKHGREGRATGSKFHSENQQILGSCVQHSIARDLCTPVTQYDIKQYTHKTKAKATNTELNYLLKQYLLYTQLLKNNSKSAYSFSNLRPSVFHKATTIDLSAHFDGTRYGGPTLNFMNGTYFGLLLFIRFQAWEEIFLFSRVSRQVLRHTQHPVQWVMGTLSQRLKQLRCKVYTHLHLVHKLRITGGIPPVTYMPSWRTQEELYVISLRFVQSFEF
jgi:hypothetical protein